MFDYVFKRKRTWITIFILDILGSILFFFRNREIPSQIQRILVIRLDHIGDLVMSTPFFTRLREQYPAAEIHLLCDANAVNLFDNDPRFDQIIPMDDHWFSRSRKANWFSLLQRALQLRHFHYDLGFDLRGDFRTIFFFMFIPGVKYRVSYGVRGGGFMLNKEPLYPARKHEVEKNIHLLAASTNRKIMPGNPSLVIDLEVKKFMETKLDQLGRNRNKKLIAAHLGAGYPSKQWGEDHFRRVLEVILDFDQYQVCLLGKKDEILLPMEFLEQHDVLNALGATSLKELAALISLSDFFIGNDSGPAHIASAFSVPILSVFSGTNRVEEFRPWANISEVIYKDLECSPCEEKNCPLKHHDCMTLITEDEVLDGFRKLAREAAEARR
ncbi:MAG: glycosyltransferase family 9 protein [Candidatus Omnitrophica bacterium]|nr:glycosyltransferase family 9 protein [Candidatus Omnitrophota bacterium]